MVLLKTINFNFLLLCFFKIFLLLKFRLVGKLPTRRFDSKNNLKIKKILKILIAVLNKFFERDFNP